MEKKMECLLSVIVAIYNIEEFLPACLDSIIGQTYRNLEIILVDDGSTDQSPRICDDCQQKDNRIITIHKPNNGLVSARKAGLELASGEYISFVDGDDWLDIQMYDKMMNEIGEEKPDILACGFLLEMPDGVSEVENAVKSGSYQTDKMEHAIYPEMLCGNESFQGSIISAVWNKLFRRESVLKNIMAVDDEITIGEDVIITFSNLLTAERVVVSNEIRLYHYRYNPGAMTKAHDPRFIFHMEHLFAALDNIEKKSKLVMLRNQVNHYKIYMLLQYGIQNVIGKYGWWNIREFCRYFQTLLSNDSFYREIRDCDTFILPATGKQKRILMALSHRRVLFAAMLQCLPEKLIKWSKGF